MDLHDYSVLPKMIVFDLGIKSFLLTGMMFITKPSVTYSNSAVDYTLWPLWIEMYIPPFSLDR